MTEKTTKLNLDASGMISEINAITGALDEYNRAVATATLLTTRQGQKAERIAGPLKQLGAASAAVADNIKQLASTGDLRGLQTLGSQIRTMVQDTRALAEAFDSLKLKKSRVVGLSHLDKATADTFRSVADAGEKQFNSILHRIGKRIEAGMTRINPMVGFAGPGSMKQHYVKLMGNIDKASESNSELAQVTGRLGLRLKAFDTMTANALKGLDFSLLTDSTQRFAKMLEASAIRTTNSLAAISSAANPTAAALVGAMQSVRQLDNAAAHLAQSLSVYSRERGRTIDASRRLTQRLEADLRTRLQQATEARPSRQVPRIGMAGPSMYPDWFQSYLSQTGGIIGPSAKMKIPQGAQYPQTDPMVILRSVMSQVLQREGFTGTPGLNPGRAAAKHMLTGPGKGVAKTVRAYAQLFVPYEVIDQDLMGEAARMGQEMSKPHQLGTGIAGYGRVLPGADIYEQIQEEQEKEAKKQRTQMQKMRQRIAKARLLGNISTWGANAPREVLKEGTPFVEGGLLDWMLNQALMETSLQRLGSAATPRKLLENIPTSGSPAKQAKLLAEAQRLIEGGTNKRGGGASMTDILSGNLSRYGKGASFAQLTEGIADVTKHLTGLRKILSGMFPDINRQDIYKYSMGGPSPFNKAGARIDPKVGTQVNTAVAEAILKNVVNALKAGTADISGARNVVANLLGIKPATTGPVYMSANAPAGTGHLGEFWPQDTWAERPGARVSGPAVRLDPKLATSVYGYNPKAGTDLMSRQAAKTIAHEVLHSMTPGMQDFGQDIGAAMMHEVITEINTRRAVGATEGAYGAEIKAMLPLLQKLNTAALSRLQTVAPANLKESLISEIGKTTGRGDMARAAVEQIGRELARMNQGRLVQAAGQPDPAFKLTTEAMDDLARKTRLLGGSFFDLVSAFKKLTGGGTGSMAEYKALEAAMNRAKLLTRPELQRLVAPGAGPIGAGPQAQPGLPLVGPIPGQKRITYNPSKAPVEPKLGTLDPDTGAEYIGNGWWSDPMGGYYNAKTGATAPHGKEPAGTRRLGGSYVDPAAASRGTRPPTGGPGALTPVYKPEADGWYKTDDGAYYHPQTGTWSKEMPKSPPTSRGSARRGRGGRGGRGGNFNFFFGGGGGGGGGFGQVINDAAGQPIAWYNPQAGGWQYGGRAGGWGNASPFTNGGAYGRAWGAPPGHTPSGIGTILSGLFGGSGGGGVGGGPPTGFGGGGFRGAWNRMYAPYRIKAQMGGEMFGGIARIASTQMILSYMFQLQGKMAASIEKAAEFSKSLGQIQTLSEDAAQMGLGPLGDAIERVAVAYGQTLSTTSAAVYQALSDQMGALAGGTESFAKALSFVEDSAILAQSALMPLNDAASTLASIINSYDLGSGSARDLSGKIFETINLGRITGPEMAQTLGRVMPLGAEVGASVDEVLASIAHLTIQGIKSSEAYTLVSNVFLKLIRPTQALSEEYKRLGIESVALEVRSRGLKGFLEYITKRSGTAAEEIGELFNQIRGMRGVMSLTGRDSKGYDEILEKIKKADAAVAELAAKKIMLTPGFRYDKMKAEFEAFWATDIGPIMLESFMGVVNAVGGPKNLMTGLTGATAIGTAGLVVIGMDQLVKAAFSIGAQLESVFLAMNAPGLAGYAKGVPGYGIALTLGAAIAGAIAAEAARPSYTSQDRMEKQKAFLDTSKIRWDTELAEMEDITEERVDKLRKYGRTASELFGSIQRSYNADVAAATKWSESVDTAMSRSIQGRIALLQGFIGQLQQLQASAEQAALRNRQVIAAARNAVGNTIFERSVRNAPDYVRGQSYQRRAQQYAAAAFQAGDEKYAEELMGRAEQYASQAYDITGNEAAINDILRQRIQLMDMMTAKQQALAADAKAAEEQNQAVLVTIEETYSKLQKLSLIKQGDVDEAEFGRIQEQRVALAAQIDEALQKISTPKTLGSVLDSNTLRKQIEELKQGFASPLTGEMGSLEQAYRDIGARTVEILSNTKTQLDSIMVETINGVKVSINDIIAEVSGAPVRALEGYQKNIQAFSELQANVEKDMRKGPDYQKNVQLQEAATSAIDLAANQLKASYGTQLGMYKGRSPFGIKGEYVAKLPDDLYEKVTGRKPSLSRPERRITGEEFFNKPELWGEILKRGRFDQTPWASLTNTIAARGEEFLKFSQIIDDLVKQYKTASKAGDKKEMVEIINKLERFRNAYEESRSEGILPELLDPVAAASAQASEAISSLAQSLKEWGNLEAQLTETKPLFESINGQMPAVEEALGKMKLFSTQFGEAITQTNAEFKRFDAKPIADEAESARQSLQGLMEEMKGVLERAKELREQGLAPTPGGGVPAKETGYTRFASWNPQDQGAPRMPQVDTGYQTAASAIGIATPRGTIFNPYVAGQPAGAPTFQDLPGSIVNPFLDRSTMPWQSAGPQTLSYVEAYSPFSQRGSYDPSKLFYKNWYSGDIPQGEMAPGRYGWGAAVGGRPQREWIPEAPRQYEWNAQGLWRPTDEQPLWNRPNVASELFVEPSLRDPAQAAKTLGDQLPPVPIEPETLPPGPWEQGLPAAPDYYEPAMQENGDLEALIPAVGDLQIAFSGVAQNATDANFSMYGVASSANSAGSAMFNVSNAAIYAAQALYSIPSAGPAAASHGGLVVRRFAEGGDVVQAALTPGEFVMNPRSTQKWYPYIKAMNRFDQPRYAQGGDVTNVGDINVTVNAGNGKVDGREVAAAVRRELRKGTTRL